MKQEEIEKIQEKRIRIFSRLRLKNIFPGEWESIYNGDGIEFADIRQFEPGDNSRDIDLLALVQSGEELIIERVETRQLRVYVWADYSSSMQQFPEMLFPQKSLISDIAAGLIIFSALKIYSPVGFCPFGLVKKKFFPPRTGEEHCREIIKWITKEENLHFRVSSGVERDLAILSQLSQSRSIIFLISDFKQKFFEDDFTGFLSKIAGKFDFIPVVVRDPLEKSGKLERTVRIKVQSSDESAKSEEIFLTPKTLEKMQEISRKHIQHLALNFRKLNIEHLVLDSASIDECHKLFSDFFQARKKTML